jgi:hypothetical protein
VYSYAVLAFVIAVTVMPVIFELHGDSCCEAAQMVSEQSVNKDFDDHVCNWHGTSVADGWRGSMELCLLSSSTTSFHILAGLLETRRRTLPLACLSHASCALHTAAGKR